MSSRIAKVFLELAREPGHPFGDSKYAYHIYLPLTDDGRIDADSWMQNPARCRVRRFRPGEEAMNGRLRRGPGSRWFFDYDDRTDFDDEAGFRYDSERFVPGEYVSIREDDGSLHTFQVIDVRPQ
ncbi:hypothetical protein [Devosia nitrariae]|uniref:hypothetical protein n=1 Tax=Devosia nitrariae TaxID=2071872 RepID=UPI0024E0613C|nr:hypothetical protein [Devosia nitrariae]